MSGHVSSFFGADTGHEDHDVDERTGVLSFPFGRHLVTASVAGRRRHRLREPAEPPPRPATPCRSPDAPRVLKPWSLPDPQLPVAIEARTRSDEDKLSAALARLAAEDPSLRVERNAETQQVVLWVLGEAHTEVALDRLSKRHGVNVETRELVVPLRETFAGPGKGHGRHVKQSGGHGQYAVCDIEVEPLPAGSGFEFVDKVVGGAVPRQFIPSVEKGVLAQMERGVRSGHPLVDLRVTLVDGKSHSVDSSDMAFQSAGALALREAAESAGITVLEPYDEISVLVLDDQVGEVMSDMSRAARAGCSARTGSARTGRWCGPWCRRPSWSATRWTCAPRRTGRDVHPDLRAPRADAGGRRDQRCHAPRVKDSSSSCRGRFRGPSPRWEAMSANSSTVQGGPAYPSSSRTQLLTSAGRPSRARVRCALNRPPSASAPAFVAAARAPVASRSSSVRAALVRLRGRPTAPAPGPGSGTRRRRRPAARTAYGVARRGSAAPRGRRGAGPRPRA